MYGRPGCVCICERQGLVIEYLIKHWKYDTPLCNLLEERNVWIEIDTCFVVKSNGNICIKFEMSSSCSGETKLDDRQHFN